MVDYSRLPALYEEKGFTQTSFAAAIDLSQPYMSQIVNNKRALTMKRLNKAANLLDMSMSALMAALEAPDEPIAKSA